jgi:hypothetical protein
MKLSFRHNPRRWSSDDGLDLGDSSLRRSMGRNLFDHLVLVLAVFQDRDVLIATACSARGGPCDG